MTLVDSRGRPIPARVKGRTFSGPPPGSARRSAGQPATEHSRSAVEERRPAPGSTRATSNRPAADDQATEFRAPSRRPGSFAIWLFAAAGCAVGVVVGALQNESDYRSPTIAYLVVAPLAAGLVRRGRDLLKLVLCLPLALVGALTVAAGIVLHQGAFPVTTKSVAQEVGQQLILHPAALWAGTALAALVAIRRARRHR